MKFSVFALLVCGYGLCMLQQPPCPTAWSPCPHTLFLQDAVIAVLPVFVNVTGPNATNGAPLSNGTCTVPHCYNESTHSKWWALMKNFWHGRL